ncbi:DUF721 domain-containing protein [Streptomyces sp. cmx-10-25]|uniref:DUF721 domain-containing protein n=1 Tax=Streptomyces sp. cmx-10-25 TaxID=2790919 RepID=UPI003980A699
MTGTPEPSGVDLARQALLAAREAAKKQGAARQKPRRQTATVVRDGRAPIGFGTAIGMMMTERGLIAPAAGGSVLAQWDTILTTAAPELAGHVKATGFDEESGRLDVIPDAPAYATKTRWCAPKLIAAANSTVPEAGIQTINVLASSVHTAATATAFPATADELTLRPTAPAGPVKTRETASAGYRRALEAHRAAAPPRQEDPALAAAVERQEQVRRELAEGLETGRAADSPVGVQGSRRRPGDHGQG